MINEQEHISLNELLSRLTNHPMLKDVTLEQCIRYLTDFIAIYGFQEMYEDKETTIEIHEHKGLLPCGIIRINNILDKKRNICMDKSTDSFSLETRKNLPGPKMSIPTYKTQGRILFTSFPEGKVLISYKSIPVDEDGLPLLIDNSLYLNTLELFIKKEVFTILYDMNKISAGVLQNTQQEYAWRAHELTQEFNNPSVAEMENLKNIWTHLLPRTNEYANGFSGLNRKEYIKIH